MHKTKTLIVLTMAAGLAACQTLDGVKINGVNLNEAQGETYCGRNQAVCIVGALFVVGGIVAVASYTKGPSEDRPRND